MNVYFVSGLGANCSVFDRIVLPIGFNKIYLEWIMPNGNGTLAEYVQKMCRFIDTKETFVLLGYSFGGIIVQEMNKYLSPQKTIIMATAKKLEEIPPLFRLGKRIDFANLFPMSFANKSVLSDLFVKLVYRIPPSTANTFIINNQPLYMKWAIKQILDWKPTYLCPSLYHIHGTKDLMFPYKYIQNPNITIEGGDHLMILKKNREVSKALSQILLNS